MTGVATLTIEQVHTGLAARKFSAVELAQSAIEFAQAENPKTNAYLHFCPNARWPRPNAWIRDSLLANTRARSPACPSR